MNPVQEAVAKIEAERVATFNRIDQQEKILVRDIEALQSAYVVGYLLSEELNDDRYRDVALSAAGRLVNDPATDSKDRGYLLEQIGTIAGDSGSDFQAEAKNLLLDIATDSKIEEVRQAAKECIKALK